MCSQIRVLIMLEIIRDHKAFKQKEAFFVTNVTSLRLCCVILISACEVQTVRFIAKYIRCDKWTAVNLTRLIYVVNMR
jgi:hypothetical protein